MFVSISGVAWAEEDQTWASDLQSQSSQMVWEDLKAKFEVQENVEAISEIGKTSNLFVFVSTSMPKPLLKSYMNEAKKYGGVLVFKGLPNGSFKELAKLVTELVGDDEEASPMQIDDEAFENFGVMQVPAIVLSKQFEFVLSQTTPVVYDKITGNVGVKYALEKFGSEGDLRQEARRVLGQ